MKRLLAATLIAATVISFLYIGTTHRDRCLKDGNTGCTILPWSGSAQQASGYVLGSGSGWGFQTK